MLRSSDRPPDDRYIEMAGIAKHVGTGRYDEAERSATVLLTGDTLSVIRAKVYFLRAEARVTLGRAADAVADASASLEIDPDQNRVYLTRSNAYSMLGDEAQHPQPMCFGA